LEAAVARSRVPGPARLACAGLALILLLTAAVWAVRGWAPLSIDDATYLVVGRNVLEGAGPTRSDALFVRRSPVFPVLLALPGFLGAPIVDAAHVENVGWTLLGAVMAGLLAARLWGWAPGILAAALPLAVPLVHRLGPSLRIDPLAASLVVLFVLFSTWLGGARRWWAIAVGAGVVLGLAVLVKETTLVFAGLGLAVPLMQGRPWLPVLRDALTAAAAAALTTSWWVIWHMQLTGRTPYLRLPPAVAAAMLLAAAGWLLASGWSRHRLGRSDPSPATLHPRVAWLLPWLVAFGWSLLVVLLTATRSSAARSALLGASPADLLLRVWHTFPVYLFLGLVGVLAAVLSLRDRRLAVPALGLVAALPFAWLTLALHNEARNFLPAVLLAAVAAAGCAHWLAARIGSPGVPARRRGAWLAAAGLVLAATGVTLTALGSPAQAGPLAAQKDLERFAREIEGMVAPGSSVLVSYGVAFEFEVYVARRYDLRLLPFRVATIDPGSPTGLSRGLDLGGPIALGYQPRRGKITAFPAEVVRDAAREARYLVYGGNHNRSPAALTRLLEPSAGFRRLIERPLGPSATIALYEIDARSLDLSGRPVASDPTTIARIVPAILRASGGQGEAALRCLFRHGLWIRGSAPAKLHRILSDSGFVIQEDQGGTLYTARRAEDRCVGSG
jgi:hypothetical protein